MTSCRFNTPLGGNDQVLNSDIGHLVCNLSTRLGVNGLVDSGNGTEEVESLTDVSSGSSDGDFSSSVKRVSRSTYSYVGVVKSAYNNEFKGNTGRGEWKIYSSEHNPSISDVNKYIKDKHSEAGWRKAGGRSRKSKNFKPIIGSNVSKKGL